MRAPRPTDLWASEEAIERFFRRYGLTWDSALADASVDQVQHAAILDDPVAWAEHTLVERDTGELWELWDYQRASARYRGHTVHECAAEVGKTREIVLLTGWMIERWRGDILVAAAFDGALDDIWDELVDWQCRESPRLRALIDWDKTKLKPYRKLVTRMGGRVWFRPASHDGLAFRGVHARLAVFFEEAAKAHEPVIWSEFFRSLKRHPGAECRLYSVPDGYPGSRYAEICREAVRYEELLSPGGDEEKPIPRQRRYVRFHWPQTIRPDWGPDLESEAVTHFGSRSSAGFRRNVLGIQGEPEESIFPRELISPCFEVDPEFASIKAVFDRQRGETAVSVERVVAVERAEEVSNGVEAGPIADWLPMALERWYPRRTIHGIHVGGVDVGLTTDPCEIWVSRVVGDVVVTVLRVQLVRHDYTPLAQAIAAIDKHFGGLTAGWGLDAGGIGSVVSNTMHSVDRDLSFRISPYFFQMPVPILGPSGEEVGRVRLKEASTRLLEERFQIRSVSIAPHPTLVQQFIAHTAARGPSGERRFADRHDHAIDALRVQLLRLQEVELAPSGVTGEIVMVGERPGFAEIQEGLSL